MFSSNNNASAYSATITTNSDVTVNVVPTSNQGVSIHEESINVVSDCRAGYNLSIATPEGSDLYLYGDEKPEDGKTDGDDEPSTDTAIIVAVDGISSLGSDDNINKWGYTLASNPTANTVFSPLSFAPSVLKTSATTASNNDINDTFSIYYGVKVDNTLAPGNYRMANDGSIVYYLTMDTACTTYSVQYQDNGADNPNGMGTTNASTGDKSVRQINIAEDTKITLLAPNFKKAGYSFLGWSTDQDAYTHFTDNDNTNDPIIYGPNEDVVIDADIMATATNRNQINLYATWIPALKDGNDNPVYMQEWDNPNTTLPHDGCSTLTQTVFDDTITNEKGKITATKDSIVALTDKRDNEVYTVARLADGNCWMTENLRLEHSGTIGDNTNDPTTTNQSLSQGYGGTTGTYGNFVGLANPESANFGNTTANSIYKSDGSGDTYNESTSTLEDIGTTNYPAYRFLRYNNSNNTSALSSPTFTENYANASSPTTSGTYKTFAVSAYGNYYAWAATMANTNYYTGSSTSEFTGTSICPSGWHLPSSNGIAKEYGALSQGYGGNGNNQSGIGTGGIMSNRFRTFPNNFLYSGYFYESSANSRGIGGNYWSRSANTDSDSYYLDFNSNRLYPSSLNSKYNGFSVRCLVNSSDIEVTLNSNNGTGALSRVYDAAGNSVALPSSSNPSASIAQPHYVFKNWNTAPDGSGTSYTSNYTIPADSNGTTLYAQWTPERQIVYNDNCSYYNAGCNTSIDTTNTSDWTKAGSSITLGNDTYFSTRSGYVITSWNTARDGSGTRYNPSASYTIPSSLSTPDQIVLYAQWSAALTINFDSNGGSGTMVAQLIPENTSKYLNANSFTAPSGLSFIGWMTEESRATNTVVYSDGARYTTPTTVTPGSSITLYAKWSYKYTIVYDGNTATGGSMISSGTELKHTNVYEGTIIKLYAPNYYKTGYGFVGWSPSPTATVGGTDPIYGPNEGISPPSYDTYGREISGVKTVTFYAIWMASASNKTMQTFTAADCQSMPQTTYDSSTNTITVSSGTVTALRDERDNNVYTVARLADGKCWMIENLRLNHQYTTGANASLAQGYGGIFTGLDASENSNFNNNTNATPNNLYNSTNITGDYPGYRIPRYNNNNTNTSLTASYNGTGSTTYYSWYSYGNYYIWAAAMANTTFYNSASSESANTSLCPTNWALPTSGSTTKDFGLLSQRYGYTPDQSIDSSYNNRFRSFPNNFIYSGIFQSSSATGRGQYGFYISRSASSNVGAYFMRLDNSGGLSVSEKSNRYSGMSIRCLISP